MDDFFHPTLYKRNIIELTFPSCQMAQPEIVNINWDHSFDGFILSKLNFIVQLWGWWNPFANLCAAPKNDEFIMHQICKRKSLQCAVFGTHTHISSIPHIRLSGWMQFAYHVGSQLIVSQFVARSVSGGFRIVRLTLGGIYITSFTQNVHSFATGGKLFARSKIIRSIFSEKHWQHIFRTKKQKQKTRY